MMKKKLIIKELAVAIALVFIGTNLISYAAGFDNNENKHKDISTINGWWDNNWSYRKLITINHTKVSGNLHDFPVLISFISSDFILHAQSDGDDFVFTNTENTIQFPHEIEYYNTTTGELIAWICLPTISSMQDTSFYLYYGNNQCSNQQQVESTWDTHFLSVHHLEERTGTVYDSTGYHNDGIPRGTLNQDSEGIIDGADYFDGLDDNITLPQIYTAESQFTLEAWIYPEAEARYIFAQRNPGTQGVILQIMQGGNNLQWFINEESNQKSGISWETWFYVVLSYNGTTASLYLNDESPQQKDCAAPIWPSVNMVIGDRITGDRRFQGVIDEVRLSNTARDTAWISTCFTNQHDTLNFSIVGIEEQPSPNNPPNKPVQPIPENNSVDIALHPTLSVFVTDPDNDIMTVSFYNASDDSIIETVTMVESGTRADTSWEHLGYNKTYRWYTVANDSVFETRSNVWVFTTQTAPGNPPSITIIKPLEKTLYFRDKKIIRSLRTMIIGYITISAEAQDDRGIIQVEFYIDGDLKHISQEPVSGDLYTWVWNERTWIKAKHLITVVARDIDGNIDEDSLIVSIHNFPLLHPRKP